MPTDRERSCSGKEVQAIRFNHNEQRCLEKKISGLKQEGACSVKLINQTHKNIKVSYKNLKEKVSKIKTHLTVNEIEEFRKLEEEGKIEIFKSIAKPDSAGRIASYAKRLNIEYESKGTTARHSDDLVMINSFCDEELTRKEKLLRQISELNDRFNAAQEKEKYLERENIMLNREIRKVRNKSDSDYETDVSADTDNRYNLTPVKEKRQSNTIGPRKKSLPRPSTAFEFSTNNAVREVTRPASSLAHSKPVAFMDTQNKSKSKPRRTKSVKGYSIKETEYTHEFEPTSTTKSSIRRANSVQHGSCNNKVHPCTLSEVENHINHKEDLQLQYEPTFKTVIENIVISDNDACEENSLSEKSEHLFDKNGNTQKHKVNKNQESNPNTAKHSNKKGLKHSQSVRDELIGKDPKDSVIKRRHTSKIRPSTSVNSGSVTSTPGFKNTSRCDKMRPATSMGTNTTSTPRPIHNRALSALSAKGSENIRNIIASMNGPQRAPFDCHAAAEKEEKELFSSKNTSEEGRTKFLSRDSIESNLGHDLHEELRKELLNEEEINAIKIEDKICSFMDKLNDKISSEKEDRWWEKPRVLTMDEVLVRKTEAPKPKRVNVRKNKFTEEQQKKLEQNKYRRSSEAWKDVNKCRYLRIEESKIDLSGIKTLASDQMGLLMGLKFGHEATV